MKKMICYFCALLTVVSFCGCGRTTDNSLESSASSKETVSESENDAETTTVERLTVPAVTEYVDAVTGYPGVYIANGVNTGVNLHAPSGMCIHDGTVYEERKSMGPKQIPTATEPFLITDADGNNLSFFASAGEDYETFQNNTQEAVEQQFLSGVEGVFDSCEITDFQTFVVKGYCGIRMTAKSEMQGTSFTQTMVMVNAVNHRNNQGYLYSFTYTDLSGTYAEAIEESIATIDFVDPPSLAQQYGTPEEYVAAMQTPVVTTTSPLEQEWASTKITIDVRDRLENALKEKKND